MTDENIVTKEKRIVEELRIYNVDITDSERFYQIMREYGKKGSVAFHALLDAYDFVHLLAEQDKRIQVLEEWRVETESKDKKEVITFGGKKNG